MPVFPSLDRVATARGLKFIVIGGHAVMQHGYVRATDDADILVNKEERAQWLDAVQGLGYALSHDGGTFLQFTPADDAGWDLDLMLVPAETFRKLLAQTCPGTIEGIAVAIPKLDHLLALKLHAARHGPGLRKLKDLDDIIRLVIVNRVDVNAEPFRAVCLKHGTQELYEQIVRACRE